MLAIPPLTERDKRCKKKLFIPERDQRFKKKFYIILTIHTNCTAKRDCWQEIGGTCNKHTMLPFLHHNVMTAEI